MTDEQFDEFVDICYEELEIKQNNLSKVYGIGSYEEYWYDQIQRTLQFKNSGKMELEFYIIFIGSWAHKKNTWMWCWANKSFTEECRKDAAALKELKIKTGYDIFDKEVFDCNEEMAYELTALGIKHLNARGMYRVPGESNNLYIAIMDHKTN
jgi:hypothetical protein